MDRFRPTLGDCVLAVVMLAVMYVFSVLALFVGIDAVLLLAAMYVFAVLALTIGAIIGG